MARRATYVPLNVLLNGQQVGVLQRQTNGAIEFQYDAAWLASSDPMSVSLSLPLREDRYVGAEVIAVFDNLLPDNDAIRRQIASSVRAEGSDAYSLLSAIGRDCVGALQFIPEGETASTTDDIAGEKLSDAEIATIIKNLAQSPLGLSEDGDFRISLAGAQEKTALLYLNGAWLRPKGATPTTHIIKPQIGKRGEIDLSQSVENEHFCLAVLRALDLPAAKTTILDFEDVRVLSVERFDREWTKDGRLLRLPQEDFCQALGVAPTKKYETDGGPGIVDALQLLKASDDPKADQDLFLRAVFAFWLLGATDGHAKNFSIRLFSGDRFHMAPLYDVMSVQPVVDAKQLPWNKYKLAMAAGKSRHYGVNRLVPRHFVETAQASAIAPDRAKDLFEDVRARIGAALDKARAELPADFPGALADAIDKGARKRAELKIEEAPATA
ncbi:type II toxin-antitoxin system HipA family toxin [Vitreimonas flagellata]|uniref:type II toxin-antitoxin system HipA family toxin n=1 Tax=Vitreimonas flagellata TaxID=2560861 RepID=UPI00107577A9|nr:type II toxin-antitoxin system HipA family toxin [Vitreimonas flagellata]